MTHLRYTSILVLQLLIATASALNADWGEVAVNHQLRGAYDEDEPFFSSQPRLLQENGLSDCGFGRYSCRGTVWTTCRAMAERNDEAWCYNLVEDADMCCGDYKDCCENNKVLFTVVIGIALLVLGACILACCWFIPPCPLNVFLEERRQNQQQGAARDEQPLDDKNNNKKQNANPKL